MGKRRRHDLEPAPGDLRIVQEQPGGSKFRTISIGRGTCGSRGHGRRGTAALLDGDLATALRYE